MVELLIQNNGNVFSPIIEDGIQLDLDRKGTPGKLSFTTMKDSAIDFTEGNSVRFKIDGTPVFFGFVFSKSRNKDGTIKVTCYDQLRYLKNKDTYVYTDKTASEVLMMIAADFNLQIGDVADTKFKIESRVEDNQTLFDIIQNTLDLTMTTAKELFVLYDDYGKLTLKNVTDMKLDLVVDASCAEDFDYKSSIDGETYNKIKLSHENDETGKREIYIAQDSSNINSWGVLQYFESINEKVNGQAKADALLSLYNKKTRTLSINECFGDLRVRAGCSIIISLDLGDIVLKNYMMVEGVKHTFKKDNHTMDLKLKGGVING